MRSGAGLQCALVMAVAGKVVAMAAAIAGAVVGGRLYAVASSRNALPTTPLAQHRVAAAALAEVTPADGSARTQAALRTRTGTKATGRRAVVVGAGVAGVATALELARRGVDVVVLDSASGPGKECSAVAAGGMQRSNLRLGWASWVDTLTATLPVVSHWRKWRDPTHFSYFHVDWLRTASDPHFVRWVLGFTQSCLAPSTADDARANAMLEFTCEAIEVTRAELLRDGGWLASKCGYNTSGALKVNLVPGRTSSSLKDVHPDGTKVTKADPATSEAPVDLKHTDREPSRNLTAAETRELEPWLALTEEERNARVKGAKFQYEAAVANSEAYTHEVARVCAREGVRFVHNTRVVALDKSEDGSRIAAIRTSEGAVRIDDSTQVVIAAGAWTPRLLWTCGLWAPVYPLKGYSVAMDLPPAGDPKRPDDRMLPQRLVSDKYVYVTRMADHVRVASMGSFDGWSTAPEPAVDATFREHAAGHVPQLRTLFEETPTRCGLRPLVNDGAVLLGKAPAFDNLYVNVGPGSNGWKTCQGGGSLLADIMVDPEVAYSRERAYDARLLSPEGRVKESTLWSALALARWGLG